MADNPATSETLPTATDARLSMADHQLGPPRASFLASDATSSFRQSNYTSGNNSAPLLPEANKIEAAQSDEGVNSHSKIPPKRRRSIWIAIGLVILIIVVLAVILPVYFTVIKPNRAPARSSAPVGNNNDPQESPQASPTPQNPTTGGDGSTITTDDGSTFIYRNSFGGFWVSDPSDPFSYNAQPNSWTPPLNQTWNWRNNRIYGVNLGGWFVLEPFISPALFQKYPSAADEWSLSTLMSADQASGGLSQLEEHYNTFITEQDFAAIAGAGLNWIRLPIPFWAIETWDGEPFLAKTCWKYILRALEWARKYGLRVNLDLHTIPGSQNGYNHSGKGGQVNFMNGVMGYANAQRTLEYIRVITEYISQPQYKNLVVMFGFINEALVTTIGQTPLSSFYLQVHDMIRNIGGVGEGNGPFISIHDGFQGLDNWSDFLRGSDRIALDTHPYFAFSGGAATDPIAAWPRQACNRWARSLNNSRSTFGVTYAGEFSNGFNDCGLFLHGVNGQPTYGGDCSDWQDASKWDDTVKAGLKQFALASMDALGDWFFWTWKVGNSTAGHVESPLWSYSLGLQEGWMPTDPREASGTCAAIGVDGSNFVDFEPWQTGGVGASEIPAASTAAFPWPPSTINGADVPVTLLPSYTATASIVSLPPPTFTATPSMGIDTGNGWYNARDTVPAPTTIADCTYPDPWDAVDVAVPPRCS